MAHTINGTPQKIGLALSGGGFRAAAFHLGVFQELKRLNLLWSVDLLSCVSGGSVAGAFLALHWGRDDALSRLETYLTTRSIAVSSFIGGLLDPFESRLDKLASTYEEDLFGGASLSALKNGPRVYLNTTNLATGNMFSFVAGGGGKEEMGDWELGYVDAGNFSIARAVSASSAFPPVFPPLRLDRSQYDPPKGLPMQYVTLTDGGVYDNMGVNPGLRLKRNELAYLIISDGGKPFALDDTPTELGSAVLKEGLDIMMEQIRGLQFDRVLHRHAANNGPKPLWFSIDSQIGEEQRGDAQIASSVRTHLKALKPAQMEVLKRHGAALVRARLTAYAKELLE